MMNEGEIQKALDKARERAYEALKKARATMDPEDVEKALWEAVKAKAMGDAKAYGPRACTDDCEEPDEWGPEKQLGEALRVAEDDGDAWAWIPRALQGALEDVLRKEVWKEMNE